VTTLKDGDGSDPAAAASAPSTDRRPGDPVDAGARATTPAADSGIPQLAKLLGTIVAPTTLLTSLLYFFGWSHAYWFFDHFGVHSTMLGLTTQDYFQRSLDGLFVPLTVAACAALVMLGAHSLLRTRIAAGTDPRLLGVLLPALAVAGLVLTVAGLLSVLATTPLHRYLAVAPLSLLIGVGLLVYAAHLWRSTRTGGPPRAAWLVIAEWAGVFALVGLSLFWVANDYSAAVGRSRARQFVAELPGYPDVIVYSERSLSLDAPGVRETRCQDREAAYRFRYDGLKLVLQSGNQYLFLPEGWTSANGIAILMPRNDSLRLEFVPALGRGDGRPTC
jgi:hypothetical protein